MQHPVISYTNSINVSVNDKLPKLIIVGNSTSISVKNYELNLSIKKKIEYKYN